MKKFLSLLFVGLVLTLALTLSACDVDTPTTTTTQKNPPQEPPVHVHTEVIDPAIEATCTETGLTEGKHCSECGEVLVVQKETPIIAHIYDDKYDDTCNECGHIRDAECAHTETKIIEGREATCTVTGLSEGSRCSVCNEILVAQTAVDALGHNYTSTVTAPTATEDGFTTYTCSRCGDSYTETITPVEFTVRLSNISQIGYTGEINENLVIPAVFQNEGTWYRVTSIGNAAFYNCTSLTSIEIPDSVTSIGDRAFWLCSSLTSINIPNSVTSIGDMAFAQCSSLTSINIPDSVTSIGEEAFSLCVSMVRATIGNGVVSIGKLAFNCCEELVILTLGNKVETIGMSAFSSCEGLTSVTIPSSVTSIDSSAFGSCYQLYMIVNNSNLNFNIGSSANGSIAEYAELIVDKNGNKTYRNPSSGFELFDTDNGLRFMKENGEYTLIAYVGEEDTITLPNDIYGNPYTLWGIKGLRNVIIPEGVTVIDGGNAFGGGAFYNSNSLISVTLPNTITSIGANAFHGCSNLTSINIPDGVVSIGSSAFSGCSSLTSITLPDSVKEIGSWAFNECINLTSVVIPEGITSIASTTFSNCDNLTSVTIPSTVTTIGNSAFHSCSSLTSINIPNSITTIGKKAFAYCRSLTSITFEGTMAEWNAIKKGIDWNLYVPVTEVVCSDGTVTLN